VLGWDGKVLSDERKAMYHPTPIAVQAVEVEVTGDGDENLIAACGVYNDPPAVLYSRRVFIPILQDITLPGYELIFDFNCN
jgi:hypothetical protein